MPFPLAIPVALSAIQSLIKFRGRLDTILSLNETTKGLPFSLPPAPTLDGPHIEKMVEFFENAVGENILVIRGLSPDWAAVRPAPRAPAVQEERSRLMRAYYEAADIIPERLGPDDAENRALVAKGPSKEMRLAYYVVESHRLSRNPAVTRVLLAATDTLLEFGADNAGLFLSNPATRGLVETLLREFAVERDWDDARGDLIFKTLLGAAAVAALENRGNLPDQPVLRALFAALGDVQEELGADFVAELVTRDGFQKLIGRLLLQTADQPGLLPDKPVLKEALAAMLRESGQNLNTILGDPRSLAGVLEAGIASAAASATPLLEKKFSGKPLLAAALKSAAAEFQKAGASHALFRTFADGEFFTALYQTSLRSLAANPAALASELGTQKHVASLIAACASEFSKKPLVDAFSPGTFRALTLHGLNVLAEHPEFIARDNVFAAKVVGAALTATAGALKDGLTQDDLLEITGTIVRTASTNLSLVAMDDHLRTVLASVSLTLSEQTLGKLTTSQGRKTLFLAALTSISVNPRIWRGFSEKDLVQPLVTGLLRALASDPSGLLSGPALVPAFQLTLQAAARRGQALLAGSTTPAALAAILTSALSVAEKDIGTGTDGETLPTYLQRVALTFLSAPFAAKPQAELETWLRQLLPLAA